MAIWPLEILRPRPVSVLLGFISVVRGSNLWVYQPSMESLRVVEQLMTGHAWGAAFVLSGLLLVGFGLAQIRPVLRILHALSLGVYGTWLSALVFAVIAYGAPYASTGSLLAVLVLHMTVIRAYAPGPPGRHEPVRRSE